MQRSAFSPTVVLGNSKLSAVCTEPKQKLVTCAMVGDLMTSKSARVVGSVQQIAARVESITTLVDLTKEKDGEESAITPISLEEEGNNNGRVLNVNNGLPSTPVILHTPKVSMLGSSAARPVIAVPRLRFTTHASGTGVCKMAVVGERMTPVSVKVEEEVHKTGLSLATVTHCTTSPKDSPTNCSSIITATKCSNVQVSKPAQSIMHTSDQAKSNSCAITTRLPATSVSTPVGMTTPTYSTQAPVISTPTILPSAATVLVQSARVVSTDKVAGTCKGVGATTDAISTLPADGGVSCSDIAPRVSINGPTVCVVPSIATAANAVGDVVTHANTKKRSRSSSSDTFPTSKKVLSSPNNATDLPSNSANSNLKYSEDPKFKFMKFDPSEENRLALDNKSCQNIIEPSSVPPRSSCNPQHSRSTGHEGSSQVLCKASPDNNSIKDSPSGPKQDWSGSKTAACNDSQIEIIEIGSDITEDLSVNNVNKSSSEQSVCSSIEPTGNRQGSDCSNVVKEVVDLTVYKDDVIHCANNVLQSVAPALRDNTKGNEAVTNEQDEDDDCLQCTEELPDVFPAADDQSPSKKIENLKFADILSLERTKVAELKGTKLKFKLNEFNVLEMVDGHCQSSTLKILGASAGGGSYCNLTGVTETLNTKSDKNLCRIQSIYCDMNLQDKKSDYTLNVGKPDEDHSTEESKPSTANIDSPTIVTIAEVHSKASTPDSSITASGGQDDVTIIGGRSPRGDRVCVCATCGAYGLLEEFMRGGQYCSPGCCRQAHQECEEDEKNNLPPEKPDSREESKEDKENHYDVETSVMDSEEITCLKEVYKNRCPWQDQRMQFSWVKYLEHCQRTTGQGKAAPLKLWQEPFPSTKNLFQPGMKLEGIDPQHQSLFCVLTVVDIMGHRVKLHFDGYSDVHDFWTNADSRNLFVVGWCEKNSRVLSPPPRTVRFTWKGYLEHCNAAPAPRLAFATKNTVIVEQANNIRAGMKLEAEDRKNGWMCVSTVKDIMENRLLIHFDGWDTAYDLWTDVKSPYLHPMGWCSTNGVQLYAPKDYPNPDSFNWHEYLHETNTIAALTRSFKTRAPQEFRKHMKLEVVDKRNPMLVRLATIVDVQSYQIKINFDGWDEKYDYWVDDDSVDIHPPSWCNKTGHPLQPPLIGEQRIDNVDNTVACGVLGCKGYGHAKGPIYTTHHTSYGCPYSLENFNKDLDMLIPDRITSEPEKKPRKFSSKNVLLDLGTGSMDDDDCNKKRVRKRRRFFDEIPAPEAKSKIPKLSLDDKSYPYATDSPSTIGRNGDAVRDIKEVYPHKSKAPELSIDMQVHQSMFSPGNVPVAISGPSHTWRHLRHLFEPIGDIEKDKVTDWSPEHVGATLMQLPGCADVAQEFVCQGVDGEALLLITQDDLVGRLRLKLGHALKVMAFINSVRQ